MRDNIYHVGEPAVNSNELNSNLISRNSPVALLVGVSGFLGSFIAEDFLGRGVQVIGIDNLTSENRLNLDLLSKNRNFRFINAMINSSDFSEVEDKLGNLERIDYAVFTPETQHPHDTYSRGVLNFLNLIKKFKESRIIKKESSEKPRVVFISSIRLYDDELDNYHEAVKEGEVRFAKFVKHYKLNGRVIRLSEVFGPRMSFGSEGPIIKLIQASLNNDLLNKSVSLDFSTRALFIEDAAHLVVKSLLVGSTANKIYDGALLQPIKISEIKQILLDPLWHEAKNFQPTELPPWPTPNLERTYKELSWKPKTSIIRALRETVAYFKDHNIDIPKVEEEEWKKDLKKWSFVNSENLVSEGNKEEKPAGFKELEKNQEEKHKTSKDSKIKLGRVGRTFKYLLITALIVYGLIFPFAQIILGGLNIRSNLKASAQAVSEGDFKKAQDKITEAKRILHQSTDILSSLGLLKKAGILGKQITQMEDLIAVTEEGIEGVALAVSGTESLFNTTKIISGEQAGEASKFYEKAQTDLTASSQKIAYLKAKIEDESFVNQYPKILQGRMKDLLIKINTYSNLVDKAQFASYIMPQITAVNGKKTYLVLLQNNLELRPSGGFIGSYGKLTFENGKISKIVVDDIYNLDGGLTEVLEPPTEIRNDLGQERLFLRDSNYEPDFPTSARISQSIYKRSISAKLTTSAVKKEANGENVNGVFALNLSGSGKLLDAVGGLDLPEYGEHVDGSNLFERAISRAEVDFFPGSQAKKNYLTSLQNQLFNKIFYLSNQNWPSIIQAVISSLEQKQLLIYLSDPELFSYLASENWSGVMPRGVADMEGVTNDFLAVVESNMGANKVNFYLDRSFKLETALGKEGQVSHKLRITYKNNSPSDVFPGGKYKNRFKIYLPLGTTLTKASFGETDITKSFTPFSDYNRTGFSSLLELQPKEQKTLVLEYALPKPLNFKDGKNTYKLNVIKQAGTLQDRFDFQLTYPINFKVAEASGGVSNKQELNFVSDLKVDRTFQVDFIK